MYQLLHLLVLDPRCQAALAGTFGSKWMLPIVRCSHKARIGPTVETWYRPLGLQRDVVGQWLGRLTADAESLDSMAVLRARSAGEAPPPGLDWMPLDRISGSPALIEYQTWAMAQASDGHRIAVTGPFGHVGWLETVTGWIRDATGESVQDVTFYRATPWEMVLGASTTRRRVYFKGLAPDRAVEAHLTSALSRRFPSSFAPTLAMAPKPDGTLWWLTAECPGVPLTTGITRTRSSGAVATHGRIQKALGDSGPVDGLPRIDMHALVSWAAALVEFPKNHGVGRLESACRRVARANLPDRWIPLDLDPANIFVNRDEVGFIDLDDSHVGPAPLSISTFTRRVARSTPNRAASWTCLLRRVYEEASDVALTPRTWEALDLVSRVVEVRLAWQRTNMSVARGELQGPVDRLMERMRQHLARLVRPPRYSGD